MGTLISSVGATLLRSVLGLEAAETPVYRNGAIAGANAATNEVGVIGVTLYAPSPVQPMTRLVLHTSGKVLATPEEMKAMGERMVQIAAEVNDKYLECKGQEPEQQSPLAGVLGGLMQQ